VPDGGAEAIKKASHETTQSGQMKNKGIFTLNNAIFRNIQVLFVTRFASISKV
jgi:hypothetical protein